MLIKHFESKSSYFQKIKIILFEVDGIDLKLLMSLREEFLKVERYGDGLHQAIEAKENLKVQMQKTRHLASITYQNYFKLI